MAPGELEDPVVRARDLAQPYLHKLEHGRVRNPSPRVLERLAGVLEIPYWTLMDLAGYVPSGQARPSHRAGRKEDTVSQPNRDDSPTNAEIVRLLQEMTAQLERLEQSQERLARLVEKAESGQ